MHKRIPHVPKATRRAASRLARRQQAHSRNPQPSIEIVVNAPLAAAGGRLPIVAGEVETLAVRKTLAEFLTSPTEPACVVGWLW